MIFFGFLNLVLIKKFELFIPWWLEIGSCSAWSPEGVHRVFARVWLHVNTLSPTCHMSPGTPIVPNKLPTGPRWRLLIWAGSSFLGSKSQCHYTVSKMQDLRLLECWAEVASCVLAGPQSNGVCGPPCGGGNDRTRVLQCSCWNPLTV